MRMSGLDLVRRGSAGRRRAPPAGLGFPLADYPLAIRRRGGRFLCDFKPEAYAAAALAGPAYYVDIATGNDANPGTSWGAAVKSIFAATQLGNAGGVPFQVWVKAGTYSRVNNFTNMGPMVIPTQPAAYRAFGGRVTCWSGHDLSWPATPHATYGNCYAVARSTVTVVLDLLRPNAFGDPAELVRVADAATCNATPGSWAQEGGTLFVRRADGAVPSNINTRVLIVVDAFALDATGKSVYLEGFDFQGGANGGVFVHGSAARHVIAVDCSARYAGGPSHAGDGFLIEDSQGLAALVRCVAASNANDGISFQWTRGGAPTLSPLTIDCRGHDNGRHAHLANNGLACHGGLAAIEIGGDYHDNCGANVLLTDASKLWCIGTFASRSLGDVGRGGSDGPIDFHAAGTSQMWLERTRSAVSTHALMATDIARIRLRQHEKGAGQAELAVGGASILTD
ncbi:hypothetical protein K32_14560 [Kaistia sp. 32K]|uniref:hypothetical protein n=1 Tax=Kaistia sp. 32K TaxID=2795690 RepID=UPI001915975C|nr:hypothetical protein [Kaistia sp. 32K]BCP52839.1 hypothetical protein K32_14560 [Kaistia sp. 32K]